MNDKTTATRNVPKLRFPEFRNAGEWGQKKLRELAKRITKKNKESKVTRVLTNSAESGVIDQRDYFKKDIANKSNLDGYFVVGKGDYIYNPRISNIAPVGPISKNKIGEGIMSPLYTVFRFEKSKNSFYEQFFKSTHWFKYLRMVSNSGARHDRMSIASNDFENMPLPSPQPDEQQKIADCLSFLDDLITTQNQKLDTFKAHKKGLMQQLFPADGEMVPKLRFPEFQDAGEWGFYTLLQVAKFRRGSFPQPYGLPEWYDETNGVPFIQVFDVGDNLLLKPTTKNKISRLAAKQSVFIPKETLIVTLQGSIGRVAITQYDAYIDRTLLLFESFLEPVEKVFFAYIIQNLFEIEKEKAPGGIIKTITKEVLSSFVVKLPSFSEQQKIANCLSSLDDLITAQTQKIDTLKAHKKGLMQQLFPSTDEVKG